MANLVGSLFLKLTANTTQFQTGMKKAERQVTHTAKQFTRATKAVNGLAKGLGLVVGVGALTRLANDSIQAGSAITDMAEATNTAIDKIQILNFGAKEAGATQEQMANLLVRVQKSAADAARGLSTAKDAFSLLGIKTGEFLRLAPEQMLSRIGRALVKSGSGTRAYGAALDLLGTRNAPKLMEVMRRLGKEGFEALASSAREAGQVMKVEVAKRLDDAADALIRFKTATTVFAGEAVAFWADLGKEIANVNRELNRSGAEGGLMANYLPRIEEIRNQEERLKLMKELQGKLLEASRSLLEGETKARTGNGYFTQRMRDELKIEISSLQMLIRELQSKAINPEAVKGVSASVTSTLAAMTATIMESQNFAASLQGFTYKGFENVGKTAKTAAKEISQWRVDTANAVYSLGGAIEDGLVNAAADGKAAFADMGQYILAEINRILLRAVLLRPLFSGLGNLFGGSGTAIGSAFLGAFGGGKAAGGPVGAGRTYLVGDKGPELLTMGGNGFVTPNGAMGGGPVFNVDMRGASVEAVARLERLVGMVNGSIEQRAVAAVGSAYGRDPGYMTRG